MCRQLLISLSHHSMAQSLLKRIDRDLAYIAERLYAKAAENQRSMNNHFTAKKIRELLNAFRRNVWMKRLVADALKRSTDAVCEGKPLTQSGVQRASVCWKPWGFEVIGPIVRENVDCAEEGYTMKLIVLLGPTSRKVHEDYTDASGRLRHAKAESLIVIYGSFDLGIGESEKDWQKPAEIQHLLEGEIFHIAAGMIYQPLASNKRVAILLEVSKPNIGPGSTTRLYDPNERMRKIGDI